MYIDIYSSLQSDFRERFWCNRIYSKSFDVTTSRTIVLVCGLFDICLQPRYTSIEFLKKKMMDVVFITVIKQLFHGIPLSGNQKNI